MVIDAHPHPRHHFPVPGAGASAEPASPRAGATSSTDLEAHALLASVFGDRAAGDPLITTAAHAFARAARRLLGLAPPRPRGVGVLGADPLSGQLVEVDTRTGQATPAGDTARCRTG